MGRGRRWSALAAGAASVALAAPGGASALRTIPDTTGVIHVWQDQLPDSMTPAQVRFVAGHVDGTQKVSLQTAERSGPTTAASSSCTTGSGSAMGRFRSESVPAGRLTSAS